MRETSFALLIYANLKGLNLFCVIKVKVRGPPWVLAHFSSHGVPNMVDDLIHAVYNILLSGRSLHQGCIAKSHEKSF